MKTCARCKEAKSASEFHKNRRVKDGLQRQCRACAASEYQRYMNDKWIERTYGITGEEYQQMLTSQNGRCAICSRTPQETGRRRNGSQRLSVDHDHASGRVRGLLCASCNTMLGMARDEADVLRSAAEYLSQAVVGAKS